MRDIARIGNLAWPDVEPGKLYVERERGIWHSQVGPVVDVLRVISLHRGGQIRGYIRANDAEPGTPWNVWLPAYEGDWQEMDRAVATLVGEPIVGLSGRLSIPRSGEQLSLGGVS